MTTSMTWPNWSIARYTYLPPPASDLHVGLVQPAVPDQVRRRAGRLGQQRRESLHPPVDGHVVDLDTAFGQELLDVAVGQAEA